LAAINAELAGIAMAFTHGMDSEIWQTAVRQRGGWRPNPDEGMPAVWAQGRPVAGCEETPAVSIQLAVTVVAAMFAS
jgi:hypothetical protein